MPDLDELLPIFSSKTRLKLLEWFYQNPEEKVYINEILRILNLEARNTFIELTRLKN
jgi:hypothetical protein